MLGQGQMPGGRPWVDGFGDSGGLEALRPHSRHTYRSFFTGGAPRGYKRCFCLIEVCPEKAKSRTHVKTLHRRTVVAISSGARDDVGKRREGDSGGEVPDAAEHAPKRIQGLCLWTFPQRIWSKGIQTTSVLLVEFQV